MRRRQHAGTELHRAAQQRLQRLPAAGEDDGRHLGQPFARLQHLGLQLRCRADRRRRDIEFFRIGFGERDELLHRADTERWLDRKDVGRGGELGDGGKILERVVRQLVIEAGIDSVGARRQQQRVAVRVGKRDGLHADVAAGAALVLYYHRRAQRLLQRRCHEPRDNIGGATRRVGHDDLYGAVGIGGERRADAKDRRRRGAEHKHTSRLDDAPPGRRGSCGK